VHVCAVNADWTIVGGTVQFLVIDFADEGALGFNETAAMTG
jgi:hypothetical protein